jgi:hypothetical protein
VSKPVIPIELAILKVFALLNRFGGAISAERLLQASALIFERSQWLDPPHHLVARQTFFSDQRTRKYGFLLCWQPGTAACTPHRSMSFGLIRWCSSRMLLTAHIPPLFSGGLTFVPSDRPSPLNHSATINVLGRASRGALTRNQSWVTLPNIIFSQVISQ